MVGDPMSLQEKNLRCVRARLLVVPQVEQNQCGFSRCEARGTPSRLRSVELACPERSRMGLAILRWLVEPFPLAARIRARVHFTLSLEGSCRAGGSYQGTSSLVPRVAPKIRWGFSPCPKS